ncbi:MAG: 4'-phosphopantetheinyl transferase superfamily protein [Terracidiphilus sp.]|jgi:phosphopantetheine--protein transferase-like protein
MTEEALQEFIAALSNTEKARITAATPLNALLPGSLGRTRLDAALRNKLGISNPGVYRAVTFGDLCRLLGVTPQDGVAPEAPAVPAPLLSSRSRGTGSGAETLQVGIDLEPISALPQAADYREDEFYKNTFTAREIAYALLQPSPQETFAGIWCAKEALRKADPALAQAPWTALEVIHDEAGKPSMTVNGTPVEGALSVSHSGEMAVAVFVAGVSGQAASASPSPETASSEKPGDHPVADGSRGWGNAAIALLALLISIAALAISYFHR